MPSIANVGGSITSALALTLLAWAVRFVRSARTKRCAHRPVHSEQAPVRRGKQCAALTPAAVQQLVGAQASSQDKPHTSHMWLIPAIGDDQVETRPVAFCIFLVGADVPAAPGKQPACLNTAVRLQGKAPAAGHGWQARLLGAE